MSSTKRSTRSVWEKRVARWQDSDLTAAEFAAEIGVNASTLKQWKWQLARERTGGAAKRPRKRRKPTFVEVTATPTSTSPIEVLIGDATVRVSSGFDADTLQRTIAILRSAA